MKGGGKPSWTTRRVAGQRLHFRRVPAVYGRPDDDQRLLEDVAAGIDVGEAPLARYLQARTAFVDRAVVAVDGGMPQAVLVGAGYDGRALRYARDGVSWFEVDHPDTQKDKRARLDRLGLACTHVSFIPIDLGHEDVAAAPCSLTAASNRSRHERASSLRVTSGSSTTSVLPTAARSPSLASSPVRASGGKYGAMPSQTNLLQIGSAMRNQSSAPPPWSSWLPALACRAYSLPSDPRVASSPRVAQTNPQRTLRDAGCEILLELRRREWRRSSATSAPQRQLGERGIQRLRSLILGQPEHRMIRRDLTQLVVRGIGPDTAEERPDLKLPLLQI